MPTLCLVDNEMDSSSFVNILSFGVSMFLVVFGVDFVVKFFKRVS